MEAAVAAALWMADNGFSAAAVVLTKELTAAANRSTTTKILSTVFVAAETLTAPMHQQAAIPYLIQSVRHKNLLHNPLQKKIAKNMKAPEMNR